MSASENKYHHPPPLPGEEDRLAWQTFTRDNDTAALEWLYRHFVVTLLDYSYKMCRERSLAEDAVQNVFTYLLTHRQQLPLPQSVKFYLLRCVRNELLKLLRQHKREQPVEELFDTMLQLTPVSQAPALDSYLQKEQLATLQSYVNQLPARQKEVIYLRFFQGLRYEEIAEVMQIDQKSVYKTLYKALETLRNILPGPALAWLYVVLRETMR
ncbi:sigma-70 family RNA polymerase sigma factor [Chitinophaga agrisoli]|uniref:Sigma-70 family RNA polymerase sigma factor n=1 Tax=Chitinophaga agrisoli TaxID=2607653 RepID=A0A5B2W2L4_9BACT|nr:sigma-70 family RNA polymerase sigma factor [Chitinophaga agrisoli]KAA2245615.1 sigma-70 family RNA polymerase sigma factor [Chitinophaga agrisoli]